MNDKLKHLIAGAVISLITVVLIRIYWSWDYQILGAVTALLAGIGKELVWDKWMKKGTPEFADAWFTFWGGLGITILMYFW